MIRLETERLVIRDHVSGDLQDLYGLLSDPKVMHFIPDLQVADLEGARANLQVALEEAARPDRGKFFFAILEKANGSYMGEIGFTVLKEAPEERVAELGYFVLEGFWGRGLVTEAAHRVVRFAFEDCGVGRILIGCYHANAGSERIMIKLGATKVREYEGDLHHVGESARRVEYCLVRGSGRPTAGSPAALSDWRHR
jgi:ribosomal-protein-alanine N-acetyltransferase